MYKKYMGNRKHTILFCHSHVDPERHKSTTTGHVAFATGHVASTVDHLTFDADVPNTWACPPVSFGEQAGTILLRCIELYVCYYWYVTCYELNFSTREI